MVFSKLELYLRRLLKEALRQQVQATLDMGDLAMSRLTKCLLYVSKNERDEHGVLLCTGSWSNSCQSFRWLPMIWRTTNGLVSCIYKSDQTPTNLKSHCSPTWERIGRIWVPQRGAEKKGGCVRTARGRTTTATNVRQTCRCLLTVVACSKQGSVQRPGHCCKERRGNQTEVSPLPCFFLQVHLHVTSLGDTQLLAS